MRNRLQQKMKRLLVLGRDAIILQRLACAGHQSRAFHFVLTSSRTVVMTDKKKLTTAEILALARQQGQGSSDENAAADDAASSDVSSDATPAAEQAAEEKPAAPSATPKTTADILAAARAQAAPQSDAASEEKPAPAKKPSSTADILAAARAQGGGGKPAAPTAKPKSTADILAAARAQGSGAQGGGAAKPAAKSEGVKAKPAARKAAAPAGDRPALKEMVAAVKESQSTGAPVKPKLPVGKSPAKPKLPKKGEKVSRRGIVAAMAAIAITPFVLAWSSLGAIMGLWSLGIARFMMPNMVLELPSRFKVGAPSDFPPGTVSAKFKASRGIWIINSDEYNGKRIIYALESICTHLGCTPNWLEGEQKFKCPCHGSGFYITGVNFEGPAPRPLERVGIRVAEDGMLEVDKSVKFQEELGQWSDAKSFVSV